jgi:hypothetical protein
VVTASRDLKKGDRIRARLSEGEIQARVESIEIDENRQLSLPTDRPEA